MVTQFEKPMGTEIGNLASLDTTDKSSVVGAINSLNSKIATKYFTSVNDMVTTLNALSENEQIHFVCNATVSTSLTGINSIASGVFTKVSSTYADAIWVTNGGSNSGTSRINISTSNIVVNNLNSNIANVITKGYCTNLETKTINVYKDQPIIISVFRNVSGANNYVKFVYSSNTMVEVERIGFNINNIVPTYQNNVLTLKNNINGYVYYAIE